MRALPFALSLGNRAAAERLRRRRRARLPALGREETGAGSTWVKVLDVLAWKEGNRVGYGLAFQSERRVFSGCCASTRCRGRASDPNARRIGRQRRPLTNGRPNKSAWGEGGRSGSSAHFGLDIGHRPFERIDASPSEGSRQVRDQPALRNVSLNADRISPPPAVGEPLLDPAGLAHVAQQNRVASTMILAALFVAQP